MDGFFGQKMISGYGFHTHYIFKWYKDLVEKNSEYQGRKRKQSLSYNEAF